MSNFEDFARIRENALKIHHRMENPQYRLWGFRRSFLNEGEIYPRLESVEVCRAKVTSVPPNLLNYPLSNGMLVLGKDDFMITNIPKRFEASYLTQGVDFYWIDSIDGPRATLVHLDDSNPLHWTLVLKRLFDREIR